MSISASTLAISSAANAQAAAANTAAAEAARKACMASVRGYAHDSATVGEMREYAACIERLHPAPITDEALGVAKFAVLVIFAAMVAGVVLVRRQRVFFDGWFGAVLFGSLVGALGGGVGLIVIAGVWFGVRLLLA